nr:hypothetical protein [uncultured Sphingomonas sp.]
MPMIQVMTELDAVNEMLMSIGQAPVNTLAVSGIKDVNIAKAELTKVSRRIQSRGWNWNTDEAYELSPDIDGVIAVPTGALKLDASDNFTNIVQRRHPTKNVMALYNRDERTFEFASPVPVKIVWGFAFEDLPETARAYVATSAGRKFQSRVIGSQILDRFQAEDEATAWVLLEREERASRDTNMFRGSSLGAFGNRMY